MEIQNITKLQNGSDIRGIAMEGVEGESINLTQDMAMTIAYSFSKWLKAKTGKESLSVAVGCDSRLTGPNLAQAVCPVSYTHLDVYKRQDQGQGLRRAEGADHGGDGPEPDPALPHPQGA